MEIDRPENQPCGLFGRRSRLRQALRNRDMHLHLPGKRRTPPAYIARRASEPHPHFKTYLSLIPINIIILLIISQENLLVKENLLVNFMGGFLFRSPEF
ncbi:MAG: hypothetical protein QME13_05615, partial [Thermoanaerobacteraceae bacterium]|nr:hypothetical protein [Thermoanaerobacteraceae bacterium]